MTMEMAMLNVLGTADVWDGAIEVVGGDDCSDTDETVFVSQTYYFDADQDGYGSPNVPMWLANSQMAMC